MKHTKGSWFLEKSDWTIRSKVWGESDMMADFRGVIIADLSVGHGGRDHAFPEAEANALLMTAAADLLEAAKLALEKCPFPVGAIKAKKALTIAIAKAEAKE